MGRLLKIGAILVAAVLVTAAGASAQDSSLRGNGRAVIPGISDIDAVSAAPQGVRQAAGHVPGAKPLIASPEASALEKAQNALRAKEGRMPFAWSAQLAAEAEAGAVKATEGVCTQSSMLKAQAAGAVNTCASQAQVYVCRYGK